MGSDLRVLNAHITPQKYVQNDHIKLHDCYLDICVVLSNREIINIEMYNNFGMPECKKSLTYASMLYSHQLKKKESYENAKKYLSEGTKRLDEKYKEGMSSYEMKVMQYRTITDMIEPVLFENSPFYYETGIIPGYSDGARWFHDDKHIGGWTYWKNNHKFIDQDREMWSLTCRQRRELFYLVCGEYNDTAQHFFSKQSPYNDEKIGRGSTLSHI